MSAKKTPRHLIQEYADHVDTEKSIHPSRRRRPLSRSPVVTSTTQDSGGTGRKRKSNVVEEEEFTPRHLIQGVLDTQDTAKPSVRKSKRVTELLPPSSNKVKKSRRRSSLGVPTLEKMANQFTPRSMITGFLNQGVEETPEQRAARKESTGTRSSYGSLPDNEISFHPIEASFHKNKLEKEGKKSKVDRSRAGFHIVRRKSEKLARGAGEELDFSDEEKSDTEEEEEEEEEEGEEAPVEKERDRSRRESSRRKSAYNVEDTSAKDTSSVEASPRKSPSVRKSLSRLRPTPSKRQSVASLGNASSLEKSLPVSPLPGDLASREATPDKTLSRSKTSLQTSSRSSKSITETPGSSSKSRSKSLHARNASREDIADVERDKDDNREADASVRSQDEEADDSDLQRSPRKSKGRGSSINSSRNIFESMKQQSVSVTNMDIDDSDESRNATETSQHGHKHSTIVDGEKDLSRESVTSGIESSSRSRSQSRARSLSKSRLSERNESGGEQPGGNEEAVEEEGGEESEQEEEEREERDQPRSGRSSPRNSTSLTKNVYDFHDDSPSKKIIGKLAKTLQKSATGEDDEDIESINLDEAGDNYQNMSEENSDDQVNEEPEESIIPTVDKVTRMYYTPLRTPHFKEKSTGKPVSMVTSTPKPTAAQMKQAAKQKGKARKPSIKKKDTGDMPTSVIKGLFTHFCPGMVSKDTIAEVEKASAQFWENAAKDLESFALHAHRKTIEEADVELLMRRQKFITPKESLYSLVEKYLPLELRQEIIPICRSGNKLELK